MNTFLKDYDAEIQLYREDQVILSDSRLPVRPLSAFIYDKLEKERWDNAKDIAAQLDSYFLCIKALRHSSVSLSW